MSFNPGDMTLEEIAFEIGYQAFLLDYAEDDNPYVPYTDTHKAWADGWNTASQSIDWQVGYDS